MSRKNKGFLLFQRLITWSLYLFSGYLLYSKKVYLYSLFINFARVIYPLSIFWLQIRIKTKNKLLPIDSSMSTAELWFNILPVLASFITVVITSLNTIFYILNKLI